MHSDVGARGRWPHPLTPTWHVSAMPPTRVTCMCHLARDAPANEAEWEQHQRELESGASERRKARKERERAKARAERDSQKRKGPKAKKGKAKVRVCVRRQGQSHFAL